MEFSLERYLESKVSVDDRALNHQVREVVMSRIAARKGRLSVLEIGGGTGKMVDRLIAWGMLRDCDYTIVDIDPELVHVVRERESEWAGHGVTVRGITAAVEDWLDTKDLPRYDLIIAHAVIDVIHSQAVMPRLLARSAEGGVVWLTINFDGDTIFMPEHPHDDAVIDAYHRSMDERRRDGEPSGDSKSGRRLFEQLRHLDAEILAAGSSDWVVHGRGAAGYPQDESYFLQHILHFFDEELGRDPELGDRVQNWLKARRAQIESGELVYIAHQLDFAVAPSSA